MVVWNDFRNDARVRNEALTLSSSGFDVTVHALYTEGFTARYEKIGKQCAVKRHGRKQGALLAKPRIHTARRSNIELVLLVLSRIMTHIRIVAAVANEKPAVVHAHDVNVLPSAWLAARLCGAKLVYDAHEISSGREGYRKIGRLVAWIEKKIMPRAAGTITTTDARAKFFARAYGIPRPLVLQNRPRLVSVAGDDRIRKMLGLSAELPIVIYQGGQQPGRGLELLVACAARVHNAYFVFVGGGSLHEELKQLAERLSLTDRVFFIPTVPLAELPFFTASADIGVQPIENTCLNHFTTDSNKLFEYVVARLPIIATDLPEIARVVRANELGLLVKPGDSDALVDALNRLVDDPELRKHYSGRAERAASTLNWEEQEQSLVAMYERILSRALE